jgi:hypothetical protein
LCGGDAKFAGGGEENVGGGFFVIDFFAGDEGRPGFGGEPDMVEVGVDFDFIGAGSEGDEETRGAALLDQLNGAGEGLEVVGDQGEIDFVGAFFCCWGV